MITKVLLFGGTGLCGKAVLQRLLKEENIQLTVLVRTPSKLPEEVQSKIRIVTGNALKPEDVDEAMEGQDAVISCLGVSFREKANLPIYAEGMKNIVEAMRCKNVKYLSFIGGAMVFPGSWRPLALIFPAVGECAKMINYIREIDDIVWTGIMPPMIKEGSYTGEYKVALDKLPDGVSRSVVNEDIADWLVKTTIHEDNMEEHKHKLMGISNPSSCILI